MYMNLDLLEGTQSFLEYKYKVNLRMTHKPLSFLLASPVCVMDFLDLKTLKNKDFNLILKEHYQASWVLTSMALPPFLRLSGLVSRVKVRLPPNHLPKGRSLNMPWPLYSREPAHRARPVVKDYSTGGR